MAKFRVFIFTEPGSDKFGPYASVCGNMPNGCYNTGLFNPDAPPGQGCIDPDPKQFASLLDLTAYAAARSEALMEVFSMAELNRLCSGAPVSPYVPPTNSPTPPPRAPTTIITTTTPGPIGEPPPIRVIEGGNNTRFTMDKVYRFVIYAPPGDPASCGALAAQGCYNTGASYLGCSRSNPDACRPAQFANLDDLLAYTAAHNEIPVQVSSPDEAFAIMEGRAQINEANILTGGAPSLGMMVAVGAAALLVLPALLKRGKRAS